MGLLNNLFGSKKSEKEVGLSILLPLVDLSIAFMDKSSIFEDDESKYIAKFYYMGLCDAYCQSKQLDDFVFVDIVTEVLQSVGFDSDESRKALFLFDADAGSQKSQKCLQEGAKDLRNFFSKDSMGLFGLKFLFKMKGSF
tara:strand:- start:504 stop:923 length:420 start_codon:yes stop_codon:yes gene_type:complete